VKRFVLAMAATAALQAAAQEGPWNFAQLMAQLAQVEASKVRYSEVKRVAVLREPLHSSGTLSWARPARIEKHQALPFREVMRVDGDLLTLERDGKTHSLALQGASLVATLVESLRATLAGDGVELERHYAVKLEGTRQRWTLRLIPRDFEVAGVVKNVVIDGSGSRVARIEILEPGGDSSVMTIHHES
jgi:hypothetical protein